MDRGTVGRRFASTLAGLLAVTACGSQTAPVVGPGEVSTTFAGGKALILLAASDTIRVWADVAAGTEATLEVTGQWHLRCAGRFVAPESGNGMGGHHLGLDIGDGSRTAPEFHPPGGQYNVVVTIPSVNASVTEGFVAPPAWPDPVLAAYLPPGDCLIIPETESERYELVTRHAYAVEVLVSEMSPSGLKDKLSPLAADVYGSSIQRDYLTVLHDMDGMDKLLETAGPETLLLKREVRVEVTLLTQSVPAA